MRLERQDPALGTVELKKGEGGGWRLVKPESYPADASPVMDLVRELASLRRAGGDPTGAKPDAYGLVPPEATATFTWSDEAEPKKKKSRSVEFGIKIPAGDTQRRASPVRRTIFVKAATLQAVKKNANDFKSRQLFAACLKTPRRHGAAAGTSSRPERASSGSCSSRSTTWPIWESPRGWSMPSPGPGGRVRGSVDRENLPAQALTPVSRLIWSTLRDPVHGGPGATRADGNWSTRGAKRRSRLCTTRSSTSFKSHMFREAHSYG